MRVVITTNTTNIQKKTDTIRNEWLNCVIVAVGGDKNRSLKKKKEN